jgi:hypothetical protein
MQLKRATRPFLWCFFSGLFGAGLFGIALFIGAGGHGPDLPFLVSFPYSHVLHRLHPAGDSWPLYVAAFIQFPVYGLIYQAACKPGRRLVAGCGIVVVHALAVCTCFLPGSLYERFW